MRYNAATLSRSILALTNFALPHLAKTKGSVVNVASLAAHSSGEQVGIPMFSLFLAQEQKNYYQLPALNEKLVAIDFKKRREHSTRNGP